MNYRIPIFVGLFFIIGLLLYNNKLQESFESDETEVSNEDREVSFMTPVSLYKAYMDTSCKNNYCCEDGMTFNEELGVCLKNNDSSYLSEFHALGTPPIPPPKLAELR